MSPARRKSIQTMVDQILEFLNIQVPVDLYSLIAKLGGEIEEVKLDSDLDGLIRKKGNSFIIQINNSKPSFRKNFTIAHELGHLFLHMGFLIDDEKWNSLTEFEDSYARKGFSKEESEANEFAASLLMPSQLFIDKVHSVVNNNKVNLDDLAKFFNVSSEAVRIRGRWLGVFSW
jgi:Zn-dependent peptidase ImmA (M78 family)